MVFVDKYCIDICCCIVIIYFKQAIACKKENKQQ